MSVSEKVKEIRMFDDYDIDYIQNPDADFSLEERFEMLLMLVKARERWIEDIERRLQELEDEPPHRHSIGAGVFSGKNER